MGDYIIKKFTIKTKDYGAQLPQPRNGYQLDDPGANMESPQYSFTSTAPVPTDPAPDEDINFFSHEPNYESYEECCAFFKEKFSFNKFSEPEPTKNVIYNLCLLHKHFIESGYKGWYRGIKWGTLPYVVLKIVTENCDIRLKSAKTFADYYLNESSDLYYQAPENGGDKSATMINASAIVMQRMIDAMKDDEKGT